MIDELLTTCVLQINTFKAFHPTKEPAPNALSVYKDANQHIRIQRPGKGPESLHPELLLSNYLDPLHPESGDLFLVYV